MFEKFGNFIKNLFSRKKETRGSTSETLEAVVKKDDVPAASEKLEVVAKKEDVLTTSLSSTAEKTPKPPDQVAWYGEIGLVEDRRPTLGYSHGSDSRLSMPVSMKSSAFRKHFLEPENASPASKEMAKLVDRDDDSTVTGQFTFGGNERWNEPFPPKTLMTAAGGFTNHTTGVSGYVKTTLDPERSHARSLVAGFSYDPLKVVPHPMEEKTPRSVSLQPPLGQLSLVETKQDDSSEDSFRLLADSSLFRESFTPSRFLLIPGTLPNWYERYAMSIPSEMFMVAKILSFAIPILNILTVTSLVFSQPVGGETLSQTTSRPKTVSILALARLSIQVVKGHFWSPQKKLLQNVLIESFERDVIWGSKLNQISLLEIEKRYDQVFQVVLVNQDTVRKQLLLLLNRVLLPVWCIPSFELANQVVPVCAVIFQIKTQFYVDSFRLVLFATVYFVVIPSVSAVILSSAEKTLEVAFLTGSRYFFKNELFYQVSMTEETNKLEEKQAKLKTGENLKQETLNYVFHTLRSKAK